MKFIGDKMRLFSRETNKAFKAFIGLDHKEETCARKDVGAHFCYEWDGMFIYGGDPEFDGICICYDIQKRRQIRKNVKRLQKQFMKLRRLQKGDDQIMRKFK